MPIFHRIFVAACTHTASQPASSNRSRSSGMTDYHWHDICWMYNVYTTINIQSDLIYATVARCTAGFRQFSLSAPSCIWSQLLMLTQMNATYLQIISCLEEKKVREDKKSTHREHTIVLDRWISLKITFHPCKLDGLLSSAIQQESDNDLCKKKNSPRTHKATKIFFPFTIVWCCYHNENLAKKKRCNVTLYSHY